jgi:hypothetical protein
MTLTNDTQCPLVSVALSAAIIACDGASATVVPVTTTSTAARTRDRGRSRSSWQTSEKEVHALCVPYVGGTYGLSRLLTVSGNRCSRLCPAHVK